MTSHMNIHVLGYQRDAASVRSAGCAPPVLHDRDCERRGGERVRVCGGRGLVRLPALRCGRQGYRRHQVLALPHAGRQRRRADLRPFHMLRK